MTTNAAKTAKGESLGYLTGILYLQPNAQLCPASTPACRAACLVGAGRGRFDNVQKARAEKTASFHADHVAFGTAVTEAVEALCRKANRVGLRPAVRLNGTSDIAPIVFADAYAAARDLGAVSYEYTKRRDVTRVESHTTYSLAAPDSPIVEGQANAQVFDIQRGKPLPAEYRGYRVIDGDTHDLRFLDRDQHGLGAGETYIVGLRLKRTKHDAAARRLRFAV